MKKEIRSTLRTDQVVSADQASPSLQPDMTSLMPFATSFPITSHPEHHIEVQTEPFLNRLAMSQLRGSTIKTMFMSLLHRTNDNSATIQHNSNKRTLRHRNQSVLFDRGEGAAIKWQDNNLAKMASIIENGTTISKYNKPTLQNLTSPTVFAFPILMRKCLPIIFQPVLNTKIIFQT